MDKDGFLRYMQMLIADVQRRGDNRELVDTLKRVRNIGSAFELDIPES